MALNAVKRELQHLELVHQKFQEGQEYERQRWLTIEFYGLGICRLPRAARIDFTRQQIAAGELAEEQRRARLFEEHKRDCVDCQRGDRFCLWHCSTDQEGLDVRNRLSRMRDIISAEEADEQYAAKARRPASTISTTSTVGVPIGRMSPTAGSSWPIEDARHAIAKPVGSKVITCTTTRWGSRRWTTSGRCAGSVMRMSMNGL